jgi:hypothetical protein
MYVIGTLSEFREATSVEGGNKKKNKKINEALAVAKIPRVLHPGVLSRTNQVISRTRDFLFLFFSVSRVIKQVDLSSVITKKWRTVATVFRPIISNKSLFSLRNSV